ncbi:MAG: hypothetical protein Q7S98_07115 [Deltaproteobacteria bacterium]|nr:hypothetical protein [Deltaproteobacteria bacterium]
MTFIPSIIASVILGAPDNSADTAPTADEVEERLEKAARDNSSFSQNDWDGMADWLGKYWKEGGYQGLNRFLEVSADPRADWEVDLPVLEKLLALEAKAKAQGTTYHIDVELVKKLLKREEVYGGDVSFSCHASADPRYQSCEVVKQQDSEKPRPVGSIEVLKCRFDSLIEQAKPFGSEYLPVRNIDRLDYRLPLPESAVHPKTKEDRLTLEMTKKVLKEGFANLPTATEIDNTSEKADLISCEKRLRGWLQEAEKIMLVKGSPGDRALAENGKEVFQRLEAVTQQAQYLQSLEGFNAEERLTDLAKRILHYAGQEKRTSSEKEVLAAEIQAFLESLQKLKDYRTKHQIQTALPLDLDSLQRRLLTLSTTLANIPLAEAE